MSQNQRRRVVGNSDSNDVSIGRGASVANSVGQQSAVRVDEVGDAPLLAHTSGARGGGGSTSDSGSGSDNDDRDDDSRHSAARRRRRGANRVRTWWHTRRRRVPYKAIALAVALFVFGSVLLAIGIHLFRQDPRPEQAVPLLVLGSITFIPGAYHTRIALWSYFGYAGFDMRDIPEFE